MVGNSNRLRCGSDHHHENDAHRASRWGFHLAAQCKGITSVAPKPPSHRVWKLPSKVRAEGLPYLSQMWLKVSSLSVWYLSHTTPPWVRALPFARGFNKSAAKRGVMFFREPSITNHDHAIAKSR